MVTWLRSAFFVCLLTVFTLGPANSVQIVAWAGMLTREVGQAPMAVALRRTFSGEAPCRMCHAAEELRAAEGGSDGLPPAKMPARFDSWMLDRTTLVILPQPAYGPRIDTVGDDARPAGTWPLPDEPVPRT